MAERISLTSSGRTERVLEEVGESVSCMEDSSPLSSDSSVDGLGRSTRSMGRPAGTPLGRGAGFGLVTNCLGREILGSRPTLHAIEPSPQDHNKASTVAWC